MKELCEMIQEGLLCETVCECDICHRERAVWSDPADDEPEAGWLYCADCVRRLAAKHPKHRLGGAV